MTLKAKTTFSSPFLNASNEKEDVIKSVEIKNKTSPIRLRLEPYNKTFVRINTPYMILNEL